MKNKYLVLAGNNKQEKVLGVNFLFPLAKFCVGIKKEYELSDIPNDSIIYINRLLDSNDIQYLKSLLPEIEKKIKGIVFEDLGVLQLLKESNSKIETILYATHAVCSSFTANAYLESVDTLILSPDITEEEIRLIAKKTIKPVSIYLFGNLPYMYSRRTLLTNYQTHYDLEKEKESVIVEKINNQKFLCVENSFGTVLYDVDAMDGRRLLDIDKVKYFFLNLEFQEIDNMSEWLNDFENSELSNTTSGFLDQETIYRLPPRSV